MAMQRNKISFTGFSYHAFGSLSRKLLPIETAMSIGRPSCINSPLEGDRSESSPEEVFWYSTKR